MKDIPGTARAVVIGGGVSGCSVAYHLADRGWDVVLLERRRLTCGTTWHAAGLIGQLRPNANMTRLARYSADLYARLEAETGIGTGMRRTGSLSLALTEDRLHEIRRQASLARAFDVEVHEVTTDELTALHPHIETADVLGAVHLPGDGQCDPAGVAMALAKGARMRGATVIEGVSVTGVIADDGKVRGVTWEREGETGTITCDHVVNCGGMWGRDLAAKTGVTLPLHACEHFYLVTEPIAELERLPVLRVPDECAYYKEDAGKILLGAFEPVAKPWGEGGIPEDFEFDSLPEDFEHFEPILETAIARMPMLGEAGIRTFFNGPESFTPDDRYYLGEVPELRGYWVAAGYNSIGIVSSGGAGHALAAWMDEGAPPHDLWDVDIRRAQSFQRSRRYLRTRVSETLGLLFADHWPFRQPETARGVRRTPLHEALKDRGAVFGETAGWERANWFARDGQDPVYKHDWHRANWFDNRAAEHMACRTDAGLFDLSTFGKLRVEGRDACRFLNRVCAGDVDVAAGRIVYTQMLNGRGGIECDLTVTRLSETAFLCIVPAATVRRDLAWLSRHVGDDFAVITDVTSGEGVIAVMGPRARDILLAAGADDLSNDTHPFGTAREIEVGLTLARAHRVSYVGELGWELYLPTDQVAHAFEAIMAVDQPPTLCGLHALDSLRCEKAFRHFGHDITDEDHVLEAGLGFAVKTAKPDFIGRDAVLRKREEGLSRRMVQFILDDPDPVLHHDETILRDGKPVSILTSGSYGHALGAAVGLGYVPCQGEGPQDVLANSYEIEIAGRRVPARASLKPLYDPSGARMRV
ncbi:MAG: FAD-dependent oxidoreductase [Pseudomonadota bacterium]